jgi:hypothetical protein
MDFFEDKADPITQLAIDDMRKRGLKAFVTEFVAEIERNGYLDSNMVRHKLKDSISRKFQGLGFPGRTESFQARSKIRNFRRVTLCRPRWPSPPFLKLFGVLFIPHALIWRLTFDIVDDAASLFSNTVTPPDILGAIFRILKDLEDLCLDYYSEEIWTKVN